MCEAPEACGCLISLEGDAGTMVRGGTRSRGRSLATGGGWLLGVSLRKEGPR